MSGDVMIYPNDWWTFVQQYQFADKDEVYTNGSMLIPSFRVRQMVEHYFGGEVGKTSRYAELFGTPERAARTLVDSCNDDYDYGCGGCPVARVNCKCGDYDALLEWLESEVCDD